MEKFATSPKMLTKCLNSMRACKPKMRRGRRICFSWTRKLYKKKESEVKKRHSKKFLAEGVLKRRRFEGREAIKVKNVARRTCKT